MPPEFIMRQRQKPRAAVSKLACYWKPHEFGKYRQTLILIIPDVTAWRHPISIFAKPIWIPFEQGKVHRDLTATKRLMLDDASIQEGDRFAAVAKEHKASARRETPQRRYGWRMVGNPLE